MKVSIVNNKLSVPDTVTIPYIEGDGIGPDIIRASMQVWNKAVEKSYGDDRAVEWLELLAGEKGVKVVGEILPEETIQKIRDYIVAIKGPLTTPIGGGYRSLNVTLRQTLDLYANIRPAKYIRGVPSPMKNPEKINAIIFRENTEDIYAGIEWPYNSKEAKEIKEFLKSNYNVDIRTDAGIGLKVISEFGSKRIVRKALKYAIANNKKKVTIVHKGNIMKYTEGAFREWGYQVARDEFSGKFIKEEEYTSNPDPQKIIINDRIADNMFQQMLTRPNEYEVIVTPNLNGDYLSDAIVAQVGGLGIAPGSNVGDFIALYEPVHGSAPKYANKDVANPTSLIMSGALMLEYIGWHEASRLIELAIETTISSGQVTYDFARQLGIEPLKTSEFARSVIKNMERL